MRLFRMERTIQSPKSVPEIVRILRTSTHRPFTRPFRGLVGDESFDLEPIRHYKDTVAPRLRGEMTATPNGTEIRVRAEPAAGRYFLMTILAIALSAMLYSFVVNLGPALDGGMTEQELLQVAVPIPLGIVVAMAIYLSFWLSAKNALDRLEDMLR